MKTDCSMECCICNKYNIDEGIILDNNIYCWDCIRGKKFNSRKEKCGDTLTHQHRIGTHPEEGQVSKETDNATSDIIVLGEENHSQQPRESHKRLNISCKEGTGEKRGAITNGEMESSPAIISQSPVDTLVSNEVIK